MSDRSWRPAVFLASLCAGCNGAAPVGPGLACETHNTRAIAEDGCTLCSCINGRWSCSVREDDCACKPDTIALLGDGCTLCPCVHGRLRCNYQPCLACPSPRTDQSCAGSAVWARDPSTGVCCKYDRPCEAYPLLTTYPSPESCNPWGCSCDYDVEGEPVPQPLECGCPAGICETLTEVMEELCEGRRSPVLERRAAEKS